MMQVMRMMAVEKGGKMAPDQMKMMGEHMKTMNEYMKGKMKGKM